MTSLPPDPDPFEPPPHGAARDFAPGAVVFREGEPGREMFVVLAGAAEVLEPGDGAVTRRLGPGGFFGEAALADAGPRLRTVRAAAPDGARVLPVDGAHFVFLVAQQPAFALAVIRGLAGYVRGGTPAPPPSAVPRPHRYRPEELRPGLVGFRSASRAGNAYLFVGRGGRRMLVDAGLADGAPALAAAMRAAGHPPEAVELLVLTHEHADHATGAVPLLGLDGAAPSCEVAAHALAAAKLAEGDDLATMGHLLGAGAPFPRVARVLEEGAEIALPPWRFRVLHAPGHCSGHLALWDAASGVLVTGDTVMRGGALGGVLGSGSLGDLIHSLGRLDGLGAGLLLPGHGGASESAAQDVRAGLAHARALLAETRATLRAVAGTEPGLDALLAAARELAC